MARPSIQNSFNAGELSPSVFGRTDLGKYHSGASTLRNFFANYRGGASSRAGLVYVGTCKQPGTSLPPRDIPFQFSNTQGYALEFGDQYMRIKNNGAYVVENTKNITGATKASPAVLTITAHGYSVGDWIFILGMKGMTNFNGLTWIVNSVPDANHVTLKDLFGNVVSSVTFNAYTSGGTAARIYTVVAPYAAVDLPYLKFTQSADTMTLTCVNTNSSTEYPPYDLKRLGNTNWTFTQITFGSKITPPTGVTISAQSSSTPTTFYSYVVTSVDSDSGEESVASSVVSIENNDIAINAGSNIISWVPVTGAGSYNIYKATPSYNVGIPAGSLFGYAGTSLGTSFVDSNIIADFTSVPPVHNNPFARGAITSVTITAGGINYSQQTVGYTITTATGSGFSGTPVVTNGSISGFVISSYGEGYLPGDTITFTDTGGGAATGNYTFTTNPSDGQYIRMNSDNVNYTNSFTPDTTQVHIASTLALTIQATVQMLNATANLDWSSASYTSDATHLYITYRTPGAAGNAFTLDVGTAASARSGATLTGGGVPGSGATGTLVTGPQSGTYPGSVAYFQQRRVYASTLKNPDTYYMSQPGSYQNMDSSIPVTDSDSIVGTPWAQQVNGVQFLVPMPGGLVVLTGKGAWQVSGGSNAAITPSDQTASPQAYNGCNDIVPPVTINYDILYVQSKGSIVRDLSYNFFVNIYTGNDLTILSNHLFTNHSIIQWAYAEEPYKIVWAVREDGILLSLTYLKDQEVYAWSRHDTCGQFVGVCSITEPHLSDIAADADNAFQVGPLTDAVYVIVKRYVQGAWRYYSERMDDRNWESVEDCVCSDSSLQEPMNFPNAVLTPAAAFGTNNISGVNLIFGGTGYTSPVVTVSDPVGAGTGATFSVTVAGGVITAITPATQGQNYAQGSKLVITDATGSGAVAQPIVTNNVVFVASAPSFTSANIGDVIRAGGGKATVTSFVSSTQIVANITQPITDIVLNDDGNTPIPAIAGSWSISTPVTMVSGLNHLEGLEVSILADGSVVPNQTVTNGSITLPQAYSAINVGLPFTAQLQAMYLDPQGVPETVQGNRKDIPAASIRIEASRGIQVGTNQPDASTQPNGATVPWTNMKEIKQRNALVNAGSAIPLFTGDEYIIIPGGWDTKGQVAVQQTYPLPANILSIVSYYTPGDTSG